MKKVALLKCSHYQKDLLKEVILDGLAKIAFDPKQFKDKRVILKPNLLMPAAIEKAVITHPEFFRAVAQIVKSHGGNPVVTEGPALLSLQKIIKKVGYAQIIEEEGIEVADSGQMEVLFNPSSKKVKRFEISQVFFDADIIINLPKFKAHGITYVTGATKNIFGAIPGVNKSKWHMKIPNPHEFAEFILDLNEAFHSGFKKPKTFLHIMDAVVGQEGEGPGPAGTPREIGAIVIGQDPVAVDYVAVQVVGLAVEKVVTIMEGFKRNFAVNSADEIEIVGETIEDMKIDDFEPSRSTLFSNIMRGPVTSKTTRNLFTEKPVPQTDKCTLCYQCMKICPAGAISKAKEKKKIPQYDYNRCIRCYCCMEICPEAAISLKRGRLQWILP